MARKKRPSAPASTPDAERPLVSWGEAVTELCRANVAIALWSRALANAVDWNSSLEGWALWAASNIDGDPPVGWSKKGKPVQLSSTFVRSELDALVAASPAPAEIDAVLRWLDRRSMELHSLKESAQQVVAARVAAMHLNARGIPVAEWPGLFWRKEGTTDELQPPRQEDRGPWLRWLHVRADRLESEHVELYMLESDVRGLLDGPQQVSATRAPSAPIDGRRRLREPPAWHVHTKEILRARGIDTSTDDVVAELLKLEDAAGAPCYETRDGGLAVPPGRRFVSSDTVDKVASILRGQLRAELGAKHSA